MTNFNPPGFNPLQPNIHVLQQNRPSDAPAPGQQNHSVPAHPEAGPSGVRQEERPQPQSSAAAARRERERFLQGRNNAAAPAQAPKKPTRRVSLETRQKFLRALDPYAQGEKLTEVKRLSNWSVGDYLRNNGDLTPLGQAVYDSLENDDDKAKADNALRARKLWWSEKSLSKRLAVVEKVMAALGPYAKGMSLYRCRESANWRTGLLNEYLTDEGGLGELGKALYDHTMTPDQRVRIDNAIKMRREALGLPPLGQEGGAASSSAMPPSLPGQGDVQNTGATAIGQIESVMQEQTGISPQDRALYDAFDNCLQSDAEELPFQQPSTEQAVSAFQEWAAFLEGQPRNEQAGPSAQPEARKRPAPEQQTEPRTVRPRTDGNPSPRAAAPSDHSRPEPSTQRGTDGTT